MALLNPQSHIGLAINLMRQQVAAQKGRPIPRGRVFPDSMRLEEEPGTQVVGRVVGLAAKQVNQRREALTCQ